MKIPNRTIPSPNAPNRLVPPRYYTSTLAAELLRQGHAEEAVEMYAALVEQAPDDPALFEALSRAQDAAGAGAAPFVTSDGPECLVPLLRLYADLLAELHGLDGVRRLRDALARTRS